MEWAGNENTDPLHARPWKPVHTDTTPPRGQRRGQARALPGKLAAP